MPKPPRLFSAKVAADNPLAGLEQEFLAESAASLGHFGRQLGAALAALEAHDAAVRAGESPADREQRAALVAQAGERLWRFVVQREACGLRDSAVVMREYRVPREVQLRMGIFPKAACASGA